MARLAFTSGVLGRIPMLRSLWPLSRGRDIAEGSVALVLKHESTGLYLASGGEWTTDSHVAHRFADHDRARQLVNQHACEAEAFALVRVVQPYDRERGRPSD